MIEISKTKTDQYVQDKTATMFVLADLIRNPMLFLDDNYHLTIEDFPTRFHCIVFAALEHLIKDGATSITPITIDEYLSRYPEQYKIFSGNNGPEYVAKLVELAPEGNFEHYYKRLKKITLLNKLHQSGIDITEYYDPSAIGIETASKTQERFDNATIDDIMQFYELKLAAVKDAVGANGGRVGIQAAEGMAKLKESLKEKPEMGAPMNSKKMATICRGRRLRKLYLRVAPSGVGKSRLSLADACLVSIPRRYDPVLKKWIKTNCQEPTLFITTELEKEEVQTMIIAYVACVSEEHILDGKYDPGEEKRVDRAISIIEKAPLWIEHFPQFNIDDIENLIKEHKLRHNISFVMFDYIFTSTKVLMEMAQKTRGVSIREDNVLMLFSDRMKSLCNKLNIHIDTSTQANGDWKNTKDPDQNLIRGSKAIADKVDIGYVVLPPTPKDLEIVQSIMAGGGTPFYQPPNLIYHVFKVRRGKLNHVKLFLYFDYSTLRTTDLFVTDKDYNLLDVENTDIETLLDETEEEEEKKAQTKPFII